MGTLGGLGAPKSGGCSAVQGDDYVYVAPPLAAANVEHVPAKSRHLGDPGTSRLGGFRTKAMTAERIGKRDHVWGPCEISCNFIWLAIEELSFN